MTRCGIGRRSAPTKHRASDSQTDRALARRVVVGSVSVAGQQLRATMAVLTVSLD